MSVYQYDSYGLQHLTMEISGLINQLEELVDLQFRCSAMIQKSCLQIIKMTAENKKAELDVSPFLFAAYKNCKNISELRNDIVWLNHYKELVNQYGELLKISCDKYAMLINESDYFNNFSPYTKERVFDAIKRNSYYKVASLIQLMDRCEEVK